MNNSDKYYQFQPKEYEKSMYIYNDILLYIS